MKYLFRTIGVFCVGILLLSTGIASAEDLTIGNYSLVSKSRVSRTEYNYIYQADITNTGSDVQNVTATLTSNSSHTIVVAGTLSFGDVPSGASVTSSDTFTIKQNRRYPLDWSDLAWDIQHESGVRPLRIKDVDPDVGMSSQTVSLFVTGIVEGLAVDVILSGNIISTSQGVKGVTSVMFTVPPEAKSGPLYVEQADRASNPVWFRVSEISAVEPAPDDIVVDDLGNEFAVNLAVISMNNGFDTPEEAERVAALVGGAVVGQVPLIDGYQVKLDTETLEELHAAIDIMEADPSVDFVVTELLDEGNDVWFDPGCHGQRESNNVKDGATLYRTEVDPTASGKIRPLFTSIGILERGIDFDAADFDGYKKLNRPNNIAIYSKDEDNNHGINVTGIVAAEAGDAGEDSGKNSGLLHALGNRHGGFNIRVEKASSISKRMNQMMDMLEAGARVFNWSFGWHKKGAIRSNGQPVTSNILKEKDFNKHKKAFEKGLNKIEAEYPQVIICASAGNGDTLNDPSFRIPSALDSDLLIVVGAHTYDNTGGNNERWQYSDYGERVDISGAGTIKEYDGNDGSGTSYATPLVASTVAAMLSINPDLSAMEIRDLLRKSALPVDPDVKDNDGNVIDVFTEKLTNVDGEVRDDGKCFYDTTKTCEGMGARLNVKGAIQAAIDSLEGKTVPKGDPVEVELKFGAGDVTKSVEVTVPSGDVFDKVDILFLVDVSGSYGDDITQFKNKAVDLVDAFHDAGKNVQTGVATFSDFPISPYGSASSGDYAYMLNQPLTADPAAAIAAINGISLHYGADGPESQLEALYQATTGAGRSVAGHPDADIAPSSVGWRSGSFPIIFLATDAGFHNSDSETGYPGAGRAQTLSELTSRGIRIYGLQSGGSITDVVSIVADTGGESFTLSRNSAEIVDAVVAALEGASSSVDIRLVPNGDFAELIQSITPEDGYQDVMSGETRTFDVTFSRHLWKRDPTADHIFSLRLEVVAEGVAVIMEIPVTVHVKFR